MLSKFFYHQTKKNLFIRGSNFDQEIIWKFGWLLWLEPIIWWFLPRIEIILLFDQVSRHYYRNQPEKFQKASLKLIPVLSALSIEQMEAMSLIELTFTALATRHLLRIISQTDCYLDVKTGQVKDEHPYHQIISHQLGLMIALTTSRLDFRAQVQAQVPSVLADSSASSASVDLNDSSNAVSELILAIHSKNKETMRFFRYIEEDYEVWSQHPPITIKSAELVYDWSVNYLNSPVAKHVIQVLTETIGANPLNLRNRFYVMCSGGIDSMTLVRIFNGLRITGQIPNASFGAIHIDWGKRNESRKEARALAQFLELIMMPYRIIKSPIDPQSPNWNQLSTDYRFRLLKTIQGLDNLFDVKITESNSNEIQHGVTEKPSRNTYFCLGHIADDLIENLICNVCIEGTTTGKQTYFDLFGMRELIDHRDVWLLRPLLLHTKPSDLDTPCFKDNASQLDIKRRVVRRAICDLGYDLSRIRKLYYQSLEMRQKYRNHPIFNLLADENSIKIAFEFDNQWTLVEWEEVMIGLTDRLNIPCLKKTIIKELVTTFKQRPTNWWTGRLLVRGPFRFRVDGNLFELEYVS